MPKGFNDVSVVQISEILESGDARFGPILSLFYNRAPLLRQTFPTP